MEQIQWKINAFSELDIHALYRILQLRSEVFVVEQDCPYQDLDGKDQKAVHVQGFYNNRLVAYCRLFKPGDYFQEAAIGRVVVSPLFRKFGFGHQLLDKAIDLQQAIWNQSRITISAQLYLKSFYETHGFVQTSDQYLEDNILHIQMKNN